jgi:hypothetical protein
LQLAQNAVAFINCPGTLYLFRCDHQGKMLRFSFTFVEDCGTTIGLFVFIDLIDAYKKANFNTWDQDKKTHEFLY